MSKRSAGQGGVCGRVLRLLQPFGEFAVRQDSPRPSGTPLINAGGQGTGCGFALVRRFRKLMLRNGHDRSLRGSQELPPSASFTTFNKILWKIFIFGDYIL